MNGRLAALRRKVAGLVRPPVAVVLAYHRVEDLSIDPQLLAVSPSTFGDQLGALRQRYEIVSARDIVDLTRRRTFRGPKSARLAITFDDGYADNLAWAAPALVAAGLPATFFITAMPDVADRWFWWDVLQRVFLEQRALPPKLDFVLGSKRVMVAFALPESPEQMSWNVLSPPRTIRQSTYLDLHGVLRSLPPDDARQAVVELCRWAGAEPLTDGRDRLLTRSELAELARLPGMSIGSHSVSHPLLRSLDAAAQRRELMESRERLRAQTNQDVDVVSYPFGGGDAVGPETMHSAHEAGYVGGFTTKSAPVRAFGDPYAIPRITVRNWTADVLIAKVEDVLAGRTHTEQ